jgi:uncharacterized PurR-regulated membrane protein YhhQ (DUF165 family)
MNKLLEQTKDALRAIPGMVTAIFILSVVMMNLLANKSIFNFPWLASTAGIFVSWVTFLCMDSVCKRFGYKAATILNTVGMIVALLSAILFMLIVKIPGVWASSYAYTDEFTVQAVNMSIDSTFSAAWYIVLGSSAAMFLGGVVNSVMNHVVGVKLDNQGTYAEFAIRSFVSTAVGQFVDNFVFGLFVSYFFFGWTMKQVIVCSIMMMLLELVFEIVFSPIGYGLSRKWKSERVGQAYIEKYNVSE